MNKKEKEARKLCNEFLVRQLVGDAILSGAKGKEAKEVRILENEVYRRLGVEDCLYYSELIFCLSRKMAAKILAQIVVNLEKNWYLYALRQISL